MKCRQAVAAALLVLLALGFLPCSFQEAPAAASGASGSLTCRFEPLQVCDQGGAFVGGVFKTLVLAAQVPELAFLQDFTRCHPDGAFFAPEGFRAAVDRPPRISA